MVAYIYPVQTADSLHGCAYLFACAYVMDCGYKQTKASNCATHGLLASDPSWSLVWNVTYLHQALPSIHKTKTFIDQPTTLPYSQKISCTHSPVALLRVAMVLINGLEQFSILHYPTLDFLECLLANVPYSLSKINVPMLRHVHMSDYRLLQVVSVSHQNSHITTLVCYEKKV